MDCPDLGWKGEYWWGKSKSWQNITGRAFFHLFGPRLDISTVHAAMSPYDWIPVPIGLLSAEDRDCVSGIV